MYEKNYQLKGEQSSSEFQDKAHTIFIDEFCENYGYANGTNPEMNSIYNINSCVTILNDKKAVAKGLTLRIFGDPTKVQQTKNWIEQKTGFELEEKPSEDKK